MLAAREGDTVSPEGARSRLPGALRRALAANGVQQVTLARELGVRDSTVSEWVRGLRFPSMEHAERLGELAPGLVSLMVAGHTIECAECGRSVVQGKRNTRKPRFCSPTCKATSLGRRLRASRAHEGTVARHRLVQHMEAVEAMCRECTDGSMVCAMAECPLRPISPAALARSKREVA